jgi:polar amino acid transport system substrate-binding protein
MLRAASLLAALFTASCAMTPSVPESVRSEMAPNGVLRAGINLGNIVIAQKDPAGGAPRGVGPELARELARRLGARIEYAIYHDGGSTADGVKQGAWDITFLAVDPKRENEIAFSAPYVNIEGTYMVWADSPLRRLEDFDRKGVRIAAAKNAAYDLWLQRNLKNAERVLTTTSAEAIELFRERHLEAVAGVRNPLMAAAARYGGLRVIPESYVVIGQAAGVPRNREASARYLREFIEEMKASGFVEKALKDSGAEATVAPPAK